MTFADFADQSFTALINIPDLCSAARSSKILFRVWPGLAESHFTCQNRLKAENVRMSGLMVIGEGECSHPALHCGKQTYVLVVSLAGSEM